MSQVRRSFLLLQGVSSPFFARLADHLKAQGHHVYKINFNAGDWCFWTPRSSHSHRGTLASLPQLIEHIWNKHEITDQILFGDRRPVHRYAVDKAEHCGIRTHVFEEGYFRPYWVTLEREGVNGHSLLPRDPVWFRLAADVVPSERPYQRFRSPFRKRAVNDVLYHLPGLINPLLYPGYRTHALESAPQEYAGFLARFAREGYWKKRDKKRIDRLLTSSDPFFLLPLQLNSDAQIRDHSRFTSMQEVIELVMSSFAKHAPSETRLLIKNHPLDYAFNHYPDLISKLSRFYGIEGRVVYVETGDLNQILPRAAGCVTVNSTAGMVALEHSCPVKALSDPIYNMPGLAFQGTLDEFWVDADFIDTELFADFCSVTFYATQVNGGFYCSEGINIAVNNVDKILTSAISPLEELLQLTGV
ncbi:capsule biosynthesis protein [Nitrincola sp. MINF-07-Sa-05]|uniref:capsule biosynthesis protein n=1 Tax=Nitrincola salilacus TaxID=3400273 RepID=UPI003917E376